MDDKSTHEKNSPFCSPRTWHSTEPVISMRRLLLLCAAVSAIQLGEKLPAGTLDYGFPPAKINLAERASGKNIILVGLPGAFTPT